MSIFLPVIMFFGSSPALGESEVPLFRRAVVFPFHVPSELKDIAEKAWWQMRETLTERRKFLVASRNFMEKKGVLQARQQLQPADSIILGRLLDAHLLIVTYLEHNNLKVAVYEGNVGRVVWESKIRLHSSIPKKDQIISASQSLIRDFMGALPYQGFVLQDELSGYALYERKNRTFFQAYIGTGSEVEVGDKVQLIRMKSESLKPILLNATTEIFAEGRVAKLMHDKIEVELLRATSLEDVHENSLVRLPREFQKIRQSLKKVEKLKNLNPGMFSEGKGALSEKEKERRPLITALSFVANIIGVLLLAF